MYSASFSRATQARRPRRRFGLGTLFALWRSRRALGALDAARLDDIGLSAKDAQAESRRPVWDVPKDWLR